MAIGACGSDPVVTFQDGQQLQLQAMVDTSELGHVTAIQFSVLGTPGNPPVAHSPLGPLESITFDTWPFGENTWTVALTVRTNDGSNLEEQIVVTYNGTRVTGTGELNGTATTGGTF